MRKWGWITGIALMAASALGAPAPRIVSRPILIGPRPVSGTDTNLLAWYKFTTGAQATNDSGIYNITLKDTGGVIYTNNYAQYDGLDDYQLEVSSGTLAPLWSNATAYCVTAWIWVDSLSGYRGMYGVSPNNSHYPMEALQFDGSLVWQERNRWWVPDLTSVQETSFNSTGTVSTGVWVYVGFGYDPTILDSATTNKCGRFFVENNVITTNFAGGMSYPANQHFVLSTNEPFHVGYYYNNTYLWKGRIDDLKLYRRNLTPAEHAAAYAKGRSDP